MKSPCMYSSRIYLYRTRARGTLLPAALNAFQITQRRLAAQPSDKGFTVETAPGTYFAATNHWPNNSIRATQCKVTCGPHGAATSSFWMQCAVRVSCAKTTCVIRSQHREKILVIRQHERAEVASRVAKIFTGSGHNNGRPPAASDSTRARPPPNQSYIAVGTTLRCSHGSRPMSVHRRNNSNCGTIANGSRS